MHRAITSFDLPLAEAVLEVLYCAETAEVAARHDANAVAQRLTLLHQVRGQDHRALLRDRRDDVPHGAARHRVHACTSTRNNSRKLGD